MRQCDFFVRPRGETAARCEGSRAMQQTERMGRLTAGLRQVQRLIAAGRAARVYLAKDADARIRQTVRAAAEAAGVPVETCESMELLGRRCRIAVPCAAAAEETEVR